MACCIAAGKNDSSNALIWEQQFEVWKKVLGDAWRQLGKELLSMNFSSACLRIYTFSRCSARLVHNAQDFWRLRKEEIRGVHGNRQRRFCDFEIQGVGASVRASPALRNTVKKILEELWWSFFLIDLTWFCRVFYGLLDDGPRNELLAAFSAVFSAFD